MPWCAPRPDVGAPGPWWGTRRRAKMLVPSPVGAGRVPRSVPPLPSWWALSDAEGLGSPAVSVWLIAPCHVMAWGVLSPAPVGCDETSDGDMRLIAGS
jgi:hypothetical protein